MFEETFDNDDQEQKLEYYEAFQKYQAIFEEKLVELIEMHNISHEHFIEMLKEEQ